MIIDTWGKVISRASDREQIIYGEIPKAERELKSLEKRYFKTERSGKLIKEYVDAEDIAGVVSRWTGIPVSRMLESEMKKLARIEEELGEKGIFPGLSVFSQ